MRKTQRKLVSETVVDEPYEFVPLGKYIVSCPAVCRGEPTFKYTRIGVQNALELLSGGWTIEAVADSYRIPVEAVQEALVLASSALKQQAR